MILRVVNNHIQQQGNIIFRLSDIFGAIKTKFSDWWLCRYYCVLRNEDMFKTSYTTKGKVQQIKKSCLNVLKSATHYVRFE